MPKREENTLYFTWDQDKAKANRQKHGVGFDEARTVFDDECARLIHDPGHSDQEDRFVLLGLSCSMREVIVCHCYRSDEEEVRLISARRATRNEATQYWRLRS
jgi:uncharacterized DUF497 family protein